MHLSQMKPEELSRLSDQELLQVAKDNKPSPIVDAFIIGFLFGIVVFSIAVNAWGILTLIPLYLIYLFLKKPKQYKAIQEELKARNLQVNFGQEQSQTGSHEDE